jgi:hypothetical protein
MANKLCRVSCSLTSRSACLHQKSLFNCEVHAVCVVVHGTLSLTVALSLPDCLLWRHQNDCHLGWHYMIINADSSNCNTGFVSSFVILIMSNTLHFCCRARAEINGHQNLSVQIHLQLHIKNCVPHLKTLISTTNCSLYITVMWQRCCPPAKQVSPAATHFTPSF